MESSELTLTFPVLLWWRLIRELRRRGKGQTESGAFILGRHGKNIVRAQQLVFYDDIDPSALKTGIVRLSGHAMNEVWETCSRTGLQVVADVHTHPRGAGQSNSDRNYPMVAMCGHIALIIPNFARSAIDLRGVGQYRYLGSKRWTVSPPPRLGILSIRFRGQS